MKLPFVLWLSLLTEALSVKDPADNPAAMHFDPNSILGAFPGLYAHWDELPNYSFTTSSAIKSAVKNFTTLELNHIQPTRCGVANPEFELCFERQNLFIKVKRFAHLTQPQRCKEACTLKGHFTYHPFQNHVVNTPTLFKSLLAMDTAFSRLTSSIEIRRDTPGNYSVWYQPLYLNAVGELSVYHRKDRTLLMRRHMDFDFPFLIHQTPIGFYGILYNT